MKKSQANQTTAKNLEEKFDRAEDVLDYLIYAKRALSIRNPRGMPRNNSLMQ